MASRDISQRLPHSGINLLPWHQSQPFPLCVEVNRVAPVLPQPRLDCFPCVSGKVANLGNWSNSLAVNLVVHDGLVAEGNWVGNHEEYGIQRAEVLITEVVNKVEAVTEGAADCRDSAPELLWYADPVDGRNLAADYQSWVDFCAGEVEEFSQRAPAGQYLLSWWKLDASAARAKRVAEGILVDESRPLE